MMVVQIRILIRTTIMPIRILIGSYPHDSKISVNMGSLIIYWDHTCFLMQITFVGPKEVI